MKLTLVYLYILCSPLVSYPSFATKIIVRGDPVFLHAIAGVYYFPNIDIDTTGANLVTLEGTKYVCYVRAQPKLNILPRKNVSVVIRDSLIQWICYRYNDEYFSAEL